VREVRANIFHAEPGHEELRELGNARREGRPVFADHRDARRRGRHDRVEALEDPLEARRESRGFVVVAAVGVELAATRLFARELDLVAEAFEDPDDGLWRLWKERVTEAGDEETDPHASLI